MRPLRNYTFGGFLDYFLHGNLAQTLFGAADLGDGNNVVMGTVSNSFSHNMSYLARGQDYLNGNGYGSSFLLETYVDFGFVGVALFSIVLGIFMIYMIKLAKKGTFGFAFCAYLSDIAVLCPTGRRNRLAPVYSHGAVLAADGFVGSLPHYSTNPTV